MGEVLKVLGQLHPVADTLSSLYIVPVYTTATASTISICNQSGVDDLFSVSVAVAGAADSTKQYIYYELPIDGNDTFMATIGITLAATDVVRVWSNNGTCSFSLFGVEVT